MNYHIIHVETEEEERIEIKDGEFICYSSFSDEIMEDFKVLQKLSEQGNESVK